jgi:hypothetical protein
MTRRFRGALAVTWDALPAEALERVVAFVTDDVLSLCAAACVSRAWRDAAERVEPLSVVRLKKLPADVAQRLTDAGLAALVRRSHGRLKHLNLRGACLVTDEGLVAALLQPHTLSKFRADAACHNLTARGVTRALAPRRGLMRDLRVRGLKCLAYLRPQERADSGDDCEDEDSESAWSAWRNECRDVIDALRELLAPDGNLLGEELCSGEDLECDCACLCGPKDMCEACKVTVCEEHQEDRFGKCRWCQGRFCQDACMCGPWCFHCEQDRREEGYAYGLR